MSGILIIVALFGLMWVLMIRPQRVKAQAQQRMLSTVAPGDEVLTVGGIYGIVQEIESEEEGGDLIVEIAEGIHVRVARRSLATLVKPDDDADDDDSEGDDEGVLEDDVDDDEDAAVIGDDASDEASDEAAPPARS